MDGTRQLVEGAGADFVGAAGIGDELNFVKTDKHTLQSSDYPNIF